MIKLTPLSNWTLNMNLVFKKEWRWTEWVTQRWVLKKNLQNAPKLTLFSIASKLENS